jgi:hypothetical protein
MVEIDVWAQQLAHFLQEHMDNDREVLREYARLAEETKSDQVRFLINVILDDEVGNHRIFQDMVNWIRAEHAQRGDIETSIGSTQSSVGDERDQLLLMTDRMLDLAKRDETRLLRELEKMVTDVADTAWWATLVDAVRHDTRKHIMLLEAVRRLASE